MRNKELYSLCIFPDVFCRKESYDGQWIVYYFGSYFNKVPQTLGGLK